MLRDRLITAFVLIPIVLGTTLLGGWWLFGFLGIGLILCGYEYFTMLPIGGYRVARVLGLALIAGLLLNALLQQHLERELLLSVILIPPLFELRRRDHPGFLSGWALTTLGVVYIGGLGAYLFWLRDLPGQLVLFDFSVQRGAILVIITLLGTWATDTMAYLAGTSFGRHRFFPEISPKKTWEGALGGIAGAALAFGLLTTWLGLNPVLAFAGGIVLGIAGTLGDLVESLVKRQVGVKDSGSLLLGHGGVWDRLDSTLFTVVVAYYFFITFA